MPNSKKTGIILEGKLGKYQLGRKIAEGGNGKVYKVTILKKDDKLPESSSGYVVKILSKEKWKAEELIKREKRFIREITVVQSFDAREMAIIPIFDSSFEDKENEKIWYLMPKAQTYKYDGYENSLDKLRDFLKVGTTLQRVHEYQCFHRDIKPANLMVYQDHLCLTDFGLVFRVGESEHITGEKDDVGPRDIRPPEMEYGAELLRDDIDLEKVDVYLFAKTLWLVLTGNKHGFRGPYGRNDLTVYLKREKMMLGDTIEPLHQLMECATKNENKERIGFDICLELLKKQIAVAEGSFDKEELQKLKFRELLEEVSEQICCDEKVYRTSSGINRVLDKICRKSMALC